VAFEEFYQPLNTWFSVRAYPSEQGLAVYFRDITETKKRTEEIDFKNTILKTQQDTSLDAILVVGENEQIISYNQRFIALWRLPPEMVSMRLDGPVLRSVADQVENREAFIARVQYLYAHRADKSREEIELKDGRSVDRYSAPAIGPDGTYYGRIWYFRDITERKQAEDRIAYLNRVYSVLSGINKLIVRVHDRDELFTDTCKIAVDRGGFRMAMLVVVDRISGKPVPVACAGKDDELINDIRAILSSDALAPGTMVARAIKERRTIISNNSERDPQVAFGPKYAAAGVRSMIVLPLMVAEEATGAIALYAREKEFFHAEETQLLTELGADIAFALDNIGRRQKLTSLARVRDLSGQINAAIVRIHDREELLRETCRIAVQFGGFRLAWAAVVDRSDMTLKPLACEGIERSYLEQIPLSLNPADGKKFGLAGIAVCENRPIVVEDMQRDPRITRRAEAGERNLHSLVTLPLQVADTVVGVLALYGKEVGIFDASEMELLVGLSGNISFALDSIAKAERIDYFAFYDALTGLANRSLFLERVALYLHSATSRGHRLAVFLIDLERFKNINDSLGRDAGDALLKQLAEWLKRNLGDANLIGRVGPDQFVTVLPHVRKDGDLGRLLENWMQSLQEHPFQLSDAVFRIAVKVGIALAPDDGDDAETLFRNAEVALKKAKASGDRYLFYAPHMTASVAGKLTLENQLRDALDKQEFELYYQPKVSLESGKLTGAEALIRWNDPRTGLVPPGRFIPVLEETGLIHEVGRWALHQAIADHLHWRNAGLAAVRIAVNVSPLQLRARGFIDEVRREIGVDARAPAGLELEITESLIMADIKLSIACLQAIRDLGVKIAIDDFGTGFSSLSYLARLPVHTLKIDRSFILDMTAGAQGLALVSTIVNLAHALKLSVVAEGVETEEQSRLLRLLDCDEMQGFIFSKPVPRQDFENSFLAPPGAG
jgi:diguanylate cyclase (GGDEF)-like protein